jgi:hypothetical protein
MLHLRQVEESIFDAHHTAADLSVSWMIKTRARMARSTRSQVADHLH